MENHGQQTTHPAYDDKTLFPRMPVTPTARGHTSSDKGSTTDSLFGDQQPNSIPNWNSLTSPQKSNFFNILITLEPE